jgi:hypothetical protein
MELFRISGPGSLPVKRSTTSYSNGQFQAIELTDSILWEPQYSEDFANKRESVACASRSILAIHPTSPRPKPSPRHLAEEEEKPPYVEEARDASSEVEAEEDYEGSEESEDDNPFLFSSTSL